MIHLLLAGIPTIDDHNNNNNNKQLGFHGFKVFLGFFFEWVVAMLDYGSSSATNFVCYVIQNSTVVA
jgi:hypothetical protein